MASIVPWGRLGVETDIGPPAVFLCGEGAASRARTWRSAAAGGSCAAPPPARCRCGSTRTTSSSDPVAAVVQQQRARLAAEQRLRRRDDERAPAVSPLRPTRGRAGCSTPYPQGGAPRARCCCCGRRPRLRRSPGSPPAFPGRVAVGVAPGALPLDLRAMGVPFDEKVERFRADLPTRGLLRGGDLGPSPATWALSACGDRPVPVISTASARRRSCVGRRRRAPGSSTTGPARSIACGCCPTP